MDTEGLTFAFSLHALFIIKPRATPLVLMAYRSKFICYNKQSSLPINFSAIFKAQILSFLKIFCNRMQHSVNACDLMIETQY